MRRRLDAEGYREVQTPEFVAETADAGGSMLALKPMNCPGHVQIYKQGLKSYRDLPLRLIEFCACFRTSCRRPVVRRSGRCPFTSGLTGH